MHYDSNRLSRAVRLALGLGFATAVGLTQAQSSNDPNASGAQPAAKPPQAKASEAKNLQAVAVTGSLIRRVDRETSNPVVTLDRTNITNTGKPTLGDVLQQLPAVSGVATNPANNSNGGGGASPTLEGGDGASRVSLRGLGTRRSLVLIDGQRMANQDLNMIPQNMIERVDVLPFGASTVYGSDAVGGVVNFILRKDYKGAEFSLNDGISSHGDGQRHGFQLTAGTSGENGSVIGGLEYNKYNPVLAPRRSFSAQQLYLSNGKVTPSGSSTIPTGRIQVPAGLASRYNCGTSADATYVTLAQGNGSSLDDYRCYRPNADAYNYNAYNYIQTAQERENGFLLLNYKFNTHVSAFANFFYNHTHSSGQDAPAPTGVGDGWNLPSGNPNNPFGVTYSSGAVGDAATSGYGFNTRLTGLGTRLHTFDTDNLQLNTGLRGDFGGDNSWGWDALFDYGHSKRRQINYNEVNVADFQSAINSGANIFNQADPSVSALLRDGVDNPTYVLTNSLKQAQVDASGELWDLPAGPIQLSVGGLYRQQSMDYRITPDAVLNLDTGTCAVLQEACGSPSHGSFNVKELYAESLIPILSQQPWAYSLNLDVGVRTSRYSTVGTTTNKKLALEWRPIEDLLVRATASEVFRAPDLDELYDGRTIAGPNLNDPCAHLTAADLAQHAEACRNVPVNWAGNPNIQVTAYSSGGVPAGVGLKPEHGKSYDFGLVYDPSWLPGFSASVDLWRITLKDMLTQITAQTVVDACYQNGGSPYCSFINRYDNTSKQAGQVFYINTPFVNLGNLSTSGIDFATTYQIPHFNLGGVNPGDFRVGLAGTYINTFRNDATPGQPGAKTVDYAGTYTQQFGNIARWRSTLTLNWTMGNWSAQWQARYIHRLTNLNADSVIPGVSNKLGSVLYHSLQLGYAVPAIHTRFDVGVDNLSNKKPPLVYQNGVNYNVDTSTYDVLGRYYWARATVTF